MRSHPRRYPGIARSKLTCGVPSSSRALKRNPFSVRIDTITARLRYFEAVRRGARGLALRAPGLSGALYELTTPRRYDSPPRRAGSRR